MKLRFKKKPFINHLNYWIFSDHMTNNYTTRGQKARHWEGICYYLYLAGAEADTQQGEAMCVHLQCRSMTDSDTDPGFPCCSTF